MSSRLTNIHISYYSGKLNWDWNVSFIFIDIFFGVLVTHKARLSWDLILNSPMCNILRAEDLNTCKLKCQWGWPFISVSVLPIDDSWGRGHWVVFSKWGDNYSIRYRFQFACFFTLCFKIILLGVIIFFCHVKIIWYDQVEWNSLVAFTRKTKRCFNDIREKLDQAKLNRRSIKYCSIHVIQVSNQVSLRKCVIFHGISEIGRYWSIIFHYLGSCRHSD